MLLGVLAHCTSGMKSKLTKIRALLLTNVIGMNIKLNLINMAIMSVK